MSTPVNVKPLSRSERHRKAPPRREIPKQGELVRLFQTYDIQAPRYTSYPPATEFARTFDASSYADHIVRVTRESPNQEISIYVHLPFCDTLCYFCGCTMVISNNREKIAEYVEYLKREITLTAELMENDPVVVQMHWGGGSPTHLLPKEIEDLGRHIRNTFRFSSEAEVSIEIDPRGLTEEHMAALRAVGFNRASVGVQDFNEDVQVAVNRVQPRSMTEQVIRWCREAGMSSINLDLIYGLPYQTTQTFKATLDAIREISPDRIAVYNFAHVPWIKPHQNLIQIETLPVATTKLALLELTVQELSSGGYEYLGMDHFAKPEDTIVQAQHDGTLHRNFQGYSTLGGKDLFGFGISAIGRIELAFAQNVKEIPDYYRMIEAERLPVERGYQLTVDDQLREDVIMQLMCNLRVQKADIERLYEIDFDEYFQSSLDGLRSLEADGLCRLERDAIIITDLGRFFLRNIAVQFDAYFSKAKGQKMFSKAI